MTDELTRVDPMEKDVTKAQEASVRKKMPLAVAWVGTVAAGILAAWEGIVGIFTGVATNYAPMVALTSVTVVGLIWYTYFTRETLEHTRLTQRADVQRRRKNIASAALAELFGLTARLRNLNLHGPSAATPAFISHPMLEMAATEPILWDPATIQALTNILRRLKDLQVFLERYAELEQAAKDASLPPNERPLMEDQRATTSLGVKIRAGWAWNWSMKLADQFVAEGGVVPDGLTERSVASFEEVTLLPDRFDRDEP